MMTRMKIVNSNVMAPTVLHSGERPHVNSITRFRIRLIVTKASTRQKKPTYSRRMTCISEKR